jgi:hypothetical protein
VRGISRLGQLCEDILQNAGWLLQHVVVPVTRDPETFGDQDCVSGCISRGGRVLTAVDLNNEALLEANEIENEVLKGDLSTKFKEREPPVPEQSPHCCFSVGRLVTHRLCEFADAFGGWSMVWRLRREPLTRRLTS